MKELTTTADDYSPHNCYSNPTSDLTKDVSGGIGIGFHFVSVVVAVVAVDVFGISVTVASAYCAEHACPASYDFSRKR